MTRTELENYINYCNEEHEEQLQDTAPAFDRFSLYEIVARDCEDYAEMDTEQLEDLYTDLELAIEMAGKFLEQLGQLCETSKSKDLAEAEREYYEKYPEDFEEE